MQDRRANEQLLATGDMTAHPLRVLDLGVNGELPIHRIAGLEPDALLRTRPGKKEFV